MRLGDFHVPGGPRFYRLSVEFHGAGDTETFVYREYFRVVARRVDLRLVLSSASMRPGEELVWRLENFGSTSVVYGLDYRIDRHDGNGWVEDPISPTGFPWVGFMMGAGAASRCQSLRLPDTMQPGRYRLVKTAGIGLRAGREFAVEFHVE